MAASTVEFDTTAFESSLRAALATMKLSSDAEAEKLAYDISNGAKQLAPVRTGRLRASIGVQPGQDSQGRYFDVGTYVIYAPRLEFGFNDTDSLGRRYNQAPRAFMRPAILQAVQNWRPSITP